MRTVEQYKTEMLHRLGELEAQGLEPALPMGVIRLDAAIRAIAQLEVEGIVAFDDRSLTCRLTGYGLLVAAALIRRSRKTPGQGK